MLTIIHGDDALASRTFYINLKKRSPSPVTLEVDKLDLTEIIQTLGSGGLFGEEKYIFIESLLTKRKKNKELSAILTELDSQNTANVYLWEGKEIDKKTLALLKHAESQLFTLPKSLFQFLDAVKPKNPALLPLFHKTLETVEPEMIFFMLTRQLRFLLAVSSRGTESIEEVKRMAPWQKSKYERQSRAFKPNVLKQHYKKLYQIDLAQKTGRLHIPLSNAIDFWLLEL